MKFGKPLDGVDYQLRKGVYAVIFNAAKDKVATVKTPNERYFLPGGGIEEQELPEESLKRELLEETGHAIAIGPFIGTAMRFFHSRKNGPMLNDGYFYLATLEEKVQEPTEADHALTWVPVSQVQRLLVHEHHHWAVTEGLKAKYS
ncbi:NUDIX hydrolase [Planomicrobium sp. CPCC 101079]|uniref:NUDIX hydrolase n=1 Tax=Planomicrobium sp. CPCC 101079 TaxID=2599618 RepID=UPI0011B5C853|nr:NUDIX domain-containing protein [Planomicrobium sp. CPCC 101079]TWT13270.1 NUDIX domain-containing protein [Planomicrobium sp. CPCC 101079]